MATFLNIAIVVTFMIFAVLTFVLIIGIGLKKDNVKNEKKENKE